ncbi:tetratricopeptide repeat protein [Gigaspora margarita]|uniref:Tetratricopeptide repeat protein n=1 Tax=Gigaspora margarita TaxID=4874 RepID=A0A8H4AJK7_GIGMA|nr:tetratricopeptide repeat protein [Gigaspora margarita]
MTFYIDKYNIFNSINNDHENEITLGFSYLNLDLYFDSIEQFNCILEINSNNFIAIILRGITYFKLEKYENALADANTASKINPTSASSFILRGETSSWRNLFKISTILQGIFRLEDFSESDINSALQKLINTLLFQGESYYSLEQYNKALLYYDKVSKIDPIKLTALSFCGKIYYSSGQYYKAFLNLNKALEINSCDMTTILYRGEAYFKLGHYNKAFYDLEKVLEKYDDASYSHGMFLEIKSNYANALTLQAKICFNLQRYEETIKFLSKALVINPKNKSILTLRGGAYFYLDQYTMQLEI